MREVTEAEYKLASELGKCAEMRIRSVLRGGWVYDNHFYTNNGSYCFCVKIVPGFDQVKEL